MSKTIFAQWRGVPAKFDDTEIEVKASLGCKIVSSQRRPFGFTVVEVAEITNGACPSCGLDDQELHAGICERCRVMGEIGS